MKIECYAKKIEIILTVPQFMKILDWDKDAFDEAHRIGGKECLSEILEKIEHIEDVDYNGHFGPSIFFTLYLINEKETIELVIEKIKEVIGEE